MTLAALDELTRLFASPAMAEPYGEGLSIRDHMLQCAALARARALRDELVAAALLHDVGWAVGGTAENHADIGADLVLAALGARVAEPIRMHVAAKRYLVTTRPAYARQLSECSRATLALQGGGFSAVECQIFESSTGSEEAVTLRLLDDLGKDQPGAHGDFGSYLAMLDRLVEANGRAS